MAKQVAKSAHIAGLNLTSTKELSASDLTKWATQYLEKQGVRLNTVNNIPVRRRKGTIEKGWADLQGYDSKGIYVAVEVKKIGDTVKPEQVSRLHDVATCGGKAYICTEDEGIPILIEFGEFGEFA